MKYVKTPDFTGRHGFSLIQMSMIVAVAGIILVSILPGGQLGSDAEKEAITLQRMYEIEEAMKGFMVTNLRRPCPADGTVSKGNVNFGVEASTPGSCINGSPPTANFSGSFSISKSATTLNSKIVTFSGGFTTSGINMGASVSGAGITAGTTVASIDSETQLTLDTVATATANPVTLTFGLTTIAGSVPVRALNLPDEYILDGYGRRIMYVVDKRATLAGNSSLSQSRACNDLQSQKTRGSIKVASSAANATANIYKDQVMAAYISYGKSGHGAFPMQGSTVANRINASGGSSTVIPDSGQINAFIDPATVSTMQFPGHLIQEAPDTTSPYNTTVWYSEETKNTCCLGKACTIGFNLKLGSTGAVDSANGVNVDFGDVNGDGIQDLVIGNFQFGAATERRVLVVFGKKTGLPVHSAIDLKNPTGTELDTVLDNGRHGFYIRSGAALAGFGKSVLVGDVTGDGYDDIIIAGRYIIIILGKKTYSSSVITYSSITATDGVSFYYDYGGTPQGIAIGNVNNDTIKDIIFSKGSGYTDVWVVYGAADLASRGAGPGNIWTFHNTLLESQGFKIKGDAVTYKIGQGLFSLASADVDGDALDDIIMGNPAYGTDYGEIYVLLSSGLYTNDVVETDGATTPAQLDITGGGPFNGAKGVKLRMPVGDHYLGEVVAAADINNDGYKDIISNTDEGVYAYYGRPASGGSFNWSGSHAAGVVSTAQINIDTLANRPAWVTDEEPVADYIKVGDVNNDGRLDLLLGHLASDTPSDCLKGTDAGSIFVLLQPNIGWPTNAELFQNADTACTNDTMNTAFPGSFRIDGKASGDYAYNVGVGDFNRDGLNDIAISSSGYDDGSSDGEEGGVFLLWGRKNIPWESVIDLGEISY